MYEQNKFWIAGQDRDKKHIGTDDRLLTQRIHPEPELTDRIEVFSDRWNNSGGFMGD